MRVNRGPGRLFRDGPGVLLIAVLLAGCTGSPPPNRSDELAVDPPDQWTADAAEETEPYRPGWLDDFSDPILADLVREAQRQNYDLRATAARVDFFRANAVIAGADRLPQVAGSGTAGRSMRSSVQGGNVVRTRADDFGLRLDLSWEIDVWGRLADRADAAIADLQATRAAFRGARLSLAAQTAQAWFNAIEANLQVRLARETVASFESTLQSVKSRFDKGLVTGLDVYLTRQNVASAKSDLAFRRRQRDAAVRALEVLLGRYPARQIEPVQELPSITRPVPAGVPSEVIQRRPDLVTAERDLAAAFERVDVAEKNLLPSISLTGATGTSSDDLAEVLDPDFGLWSIAGNLAQPLFQGGRLLARIDQAKADRRELRALYAQTALRAFREIETALAAERYLENELASLRRSVEAADQASRTATEQYRGGVADTDIITVLEAQRRLFTSRQQLLATRNERLQNRVDLYLALGGDFESDTFRTPTASNGAVEREQPGGPSPEAGNPEGAGPDEGSPDGEPADGTPPDNGQPDAS